jgi:hypothetical protein
MPNSDLADIIASLPPFTFGPAAEVPVAPDRWYFIAPSLDYDWSIAYRTEDGGWALDAGKLIDRPLFCAALPSAPLKPQYVLKHMMAELVVAELAEHIAASRFDRAAKLIDELADQVRAVRDSPLRR